MRVSYDKKRLFRTALLGGTATAVTGAALSVSGVALAQDADDEAVEEVVVTGSRIPRQDLVANSPVAVVGAEEIALQGQVQTADILNDLPQVVPGLTSLNNNPGGSRQTADLRGIGTNRTLVLVNGRRWVPGFLTGVTDMNTIPSGMVERVEVVTGGASSTYGSDAIAGVINFILKDDFEGLTASAQHDIHAAGDGQRTNIDVTMGANFADGRGNVMVNLSWFKQNPIFQGDRALSAVPCLSGTLFSLTSAPTTPFGPFGASSPCGALAFGVASPAGTNNFFFSGSSRVPQGRIDGANDHNGNGVFSAPLVFNNAGTTAHRSGFGPIGPLTAGDSYNYSPPNYLQLPITRTTMNLSGHYDINDDIEFFMEASFVNTDVATRLAPVPATTSVLLNTANPFLQGITLGAGTGPGAGNNLVNELANAACSRFFNVNAPVNTATTTGTTGTGGFSQPAFSTVATQTCGTFTRTTLTTTVTAGGATGTTVLVTTMGGTTGTGTGMLQHQTVFNQTKFGTSARAFIRNNNNGNMPFDVRRRMIEVGARENPIDMDTYHFTVGFRGQLANGWNWDTYYQYAKFRRNDSVRNDVHSLRFKKAIAARATLDSSNNPIPGTTTCGPGIPAGDPLPPTAAAGPCVPLNIFGFGGSTPALGSGSGSITPAMANFITTDATQETEFEREMFGANLAGNLVELPAGPLGFAVGIEARRESGRFSPDNVFANGLTLGFNATQGTQGRTNVWEVYAETLVPLLQDAFLAEYLALEGGIRWSKYSSIGTTWTYKAGGEWRPFSDLKIRGLFQRAVRAPNVGELFGGSFQAFPSFGDPCNFSGARTATTSAACLAWGVPSALLPTFQQNDSQVQALFSSNPNLMEETANTWTIGGVYTPSFAPNIELILDYYSITLKNGIALAFGGTQQIINACLAAGGTGPICQLAPRDSIDGQLGGLQNPVINSLANLSTIETRGLDVQFRYNFDLENAIGIPGTLSLDALYTHVFTSSFQSRASSPVLECAGFFSCALGLGSVPDDKVSARATWRNGDYLVSLRWTMVGGMTNFNNTNLSFCLNVGSLCGVPTIGAEHVLDITFGWQINDVVNLNVGVNNITNNKAPFLGLFGSVEGGTDPSTFNSQTLGPRFWGRVTANF